MHVVLTIVSDEGTREHDLGPLELLSRCRFGRQDDAELQIPHLSVSRLHCELVREGDALVVRDLGSRSGTLLNGAPVSGGQRVKSGDTLRLGDVEIRVRLEERRAERLPPVDPEGQTILHPSWAQGATAATAAFDGFGQNAGVDHGSDEGMPARTILAGSPKGSREAGSGERVEISLKNQTQTIGRAPECDIRLADQLLISRRHAELTPEGRTWTIRDLGSSNGTFVNGASVRRAVPLAVGDVVMIGAYQLVFTGRSLVSEGRAHGLTIEVSGLTMPNLQQGGYILRDVSFRVGPGELVGLIGMSGSGKTRLMHAMCGRAAFSAGRVRYGGRDLVTQFESLKSSIGYVPSKLMLHEPLKVQDALSAVSRLRLATDTTSREIDTNIKSTLEMLSIGHRAGSVISRLSDGEKRRLGLAVELLVNPPVLLLDEVTTALDLPLHCRLMKLFRELADRGQSLVLISHHIEDLELCDKWLYIIRGQVAFFGTPGEFCRHFGVASLREQLERQDTQTPEEWADMFAESSPDPVDGGTGGVADESRTASETRRARWGEIGRQWPLLMGRFVSLIRSDRTSLKLVAMLAPLVALVIVLLNLALGQAADDALSNYDGGTESIAQQLLDWVEAVSAAKSQHSVVAYLLTVSAIVIASFLAVREIVKEADLYVHERFAGLEILPYLLSKLVVLSTLSIGAILGVSMATSLFLDGDGVSAHFVKLFLMLASLSVAATAMALLISAISKTSEQAVFVLIPVLITQLALSGVFPLDSSTMVQWIARLGVVNYWAYNGVLGILNDIAIQPPFDLDDPDLRAFKGEDSFLLSLLMQWVHAGVYFLGAYAVLLNKDGPGLVERVRREVSTLIPPPPRMTRAKGDGDPGTA
jgi:ABC-type multidrug transport system ATPase subunit/pSer/pThr/pTyr-binding forkhead associated (FHA) protein